MRKFGIVLLSFCIWGLSIPLLAESEGTDDHSKPLPDVDEVITNLDDLYRANSSHGTFRMTVEKPRGTRKLEIEQWSKGDEKALMVIREPAREEGVATLMNEDGLWNYAPRADRLIRVPSGLLSDSWMGSHFTNDDLMRESSYDEDYNVSLDWAKQDSETYLKAKLKPKPDAPIPYSKVDFYLTADEWLPVEARYFDEEGNVVRTMTFSQVKKQSGRKFPHKMVLQPADSDDERTVVEYLDMKFNADVPNGLFTKQGLRRVAKTQ